ncbi:unnamed protein product [Malassezia sympodialis ATCC 42132]|nr:uncharacterized protein MSY001_1629 [Malassezia sympodialis ATCC 42132]CCU98923.1 unnamed protein product [Malassezia sympodialis ATCC 42132]|eukprot:XP_018740199.1 uncharacterized protein MSY001_1629 [Malassezia sympodialis ATCC 42132]
MFMDTLIEVHSTAYDEKNQRIYVDATQTLRCNLSFIRALLAPKARLLVVLTLVQGNDKKFYISRQEDLYAVQEMPGAVHSIVQQSIIMIKLIVGLLIMFYVALFQFFGIWVPKSVSA